MPCQTVVMTTPDDHHMIEDAGQEGVPQGSTAVFTMREAADVAGVSVSTLRRRRTELTAAGAIIDASGWQVPMTALIAVGLIPGEGEHPTRAQRPAAASAAHPAEDDEAGTERQLRGQVRELTEQVTEWRRRAEVAEARAEERGRSLESLRAANETERMALRMLTGTIPPPVKIATAPTASGQAEGSPPQPAASPAERRGGFFRRLFTD